MTIAVLSARDAKLLDLRAAGKTGPEIAAELGVSASWVTGRVADLRAKGIFVPAASMGRRRGDAAPAPGVATRADQDALMLRACAAGKTAAQIAAQLGTTRNAILGRLHRLKQAGVDPARPKPSRVAKLSRVSGGSVSAPRPSTAVPRGIAAAPGPAADPLMPPVRAGDPAVFVAPPDAAPVSLLALHARACRWPFDQADGGFLFCGAAAGDGPYCPCHAARATVPARRPERAS